ncbi:MAG: hypothetical protein ACLP4V_17450 [Methylocella sp.]
MKDDSLPLYTAIVAIGGDGAVQRGNVAYKGGAHRLGFDAITERAADFHGRESKALDTVARSNEEIDGVLSVAPRCADEIDGQFLVWFV